MTDADVFDQALADVCKRNPRVVLRVKEQSRFMRFLAAIVVWNPDFLHRYTTTIGYTIYMPEMSIGTLSGARILRHEAVHVGQWQRFWLFYPLSYLCFLPIVLTMRAYWEWEAYANDLREQGRPIDKAQEDKIVRYFTGPAYLFMFPFPWIVRRWIQRIRQEKPL